jgi:hypothetical protein
MEGVDLITEGILTLSKVGSILESYSEKLQLTDGPADTIVKHLLDNDELYFLVGTRINETNQDPALPVELELRRTLIKRIKNLLETKFFKQVEVEFI